MRLPRALSISATCRLFRRRWLKRPRLYFAVPRVLLSEAAAVRRGTTLAVSRTWTDEAGGPGRRQTSFQANLDVQRHRTKVAALP